MTTSRPRRRTVLAGALATAAAAGGGAVLDTLPAAAADAGTGTPAASDAEQVIRSSALAVRVGTAFPRVARYTDRTTGAVLHGQEDAVTDVVVNGAVLTPQVTSRRLSGAAYGYTLDLGSGTVLEAEIAVAEWTTTFRVTKVTEGALKLGTLEIPGLQLLSVRSTDDGPALMAATTSLDKNSSGDTTLRLTAATPVDPARRGSAYAVLSVGPLAAGLESDSVTDQVSAVPGSSWENGRIWRQTVARDGYLKCGLASGQWTYRASGADPDDTEPLPYVRCILTRDRNGDGAADWQDAAIALRELLPDPIGADTQYQRVVPHIPYLIGSIAGNDFLRVLDNVKRVALATDFLGQYTLVKGYQAEGHDVAHPDYGGHYNTRAGGLDALNTLTTRGKRWNSWFAVHVNCTEAYPVAHHFSEQLADKTNPQWAWADQSYRINSRWDLTSHSITERFRQLRDETDARTLTHLYIDVFRESGWTGDRLERELRGQGWSLASEWAFGLERNNIWSHWANDVTYGGDTSRGINSTLIRFLTAHQKDVFADKFPLYPTPVLCDFEGWQQRFDWDTDFYRKIWAVNVPSKYLQANPLRTWGDTEITFFGGTSVSSATGTRIVTTNGREVQRGDTYLLGWDPRHPDAPEKLYHYNPSGGSTVWTLPPGWGRPSAVAVYKLTDTGRVLDGMAPVTDGQLTLDADPAQPYVVYPDRRPDLPDPHWGEGSGLTNPYFTAGDLRGWTSTGQAAAVHGDYGLYDAQLGDDGGAASIGQRIGGLVPGTRYAASVQIEIGSAVGEARRASLTVTTANGTAVSNSVDATPLVNKQSGDLKYGLRFQRIFVWFTAGHGPTTLTLSTEADAAAARVRFSHVRVVPNAQSSKDGTLVFQDFEDVPQGLYPFVSYTSRAHIAGLHAPYTQRGWNGATTDDVISGNWSLKTRNDSTGLAYRTVPGTVRFLPGRGYRVEFDFQNAGTASWLTAVDAADGTATTLRTDALPATTGTQHLSYDFTAPASGEAWVGLTAGKADGKPVVIDNFTITPLP
ncbi:hypothetical protein BIV57_08180 [Mangrovactinospora gilvigrisea]|uniref:Endo-alpha-N-acetylgalactosaminidase n=1 Tax=Mangrovactinospora gilvigrisea TaxID=1428644 RepID=A0A1J7BH22_9ACTN|nr:endo-alpha-N-acetylgalactosaminidase family protein [Mangrovactinospora gilvigrisea]OIV37983.1 hypothetical protein BIV57_08180 [Mangrovactinospora gilvigrisea]